MYDKTPYFYGTGRRKSSVARVRLYQGTGKITINDRDTDALLLKFIKWAQNTVVFHLSSDHMVARMQ